MTQPAWHVRRAAEHPRMPWKNGLGMTTELFVDPPGATLDAFDARLSMARVDADVPFSVFAGVERTLMMLEGAIELRVGAGLPQKLTPADPATRFPGDLPTTCRLVRVGSRAAASALDLNLMVREGRFRSRVSRHGASGAWQLKVSAERVILLGRGAELRIRHGKREAVLNPDDALFIRDSVSSPIHITGRPMSTLYVVELNRNHEATHEAAQ